MKKHKLRVKHVEKGLGWDDAEGKLQPQVRLDLRDPSSKSTLHLYVQDPTHPLFSLAVGKKVTIVTD